MLSDSTNAETPGTNTVRSGGWSTPRNIFASAEQRIIVACFASNLHRIQQVCEIVEETGRRVAFDWPLHGQQRRGGP